MADISIQVDSSRAIMAATRFARNLRGKQKLLLQIGLLMLSSVRRTFREQGVPAGSWAPLSPNTIKRNPKVYGRGHKLLVMSGRLLNSIGVETRGEDSVVIGTNLKYAAVHQFGSRDFGFGARTEAQLNAVVNVRAHSYARLSAELGTGKLNRRKRRIEGPRNSKMVSVIAHQRHQNIPPRPYLVFRPEDPGRIAVLAKRFVQDARKDAGLGGEA